MSDNTNQARSTLTLPKDNVKGTSAPKKTGETVTVASKLAMPFVLRLHELREINEVTLGGMRTTKQYFPTDEEFIINGNSHEQNKGPRCRVVAGYALTGGVPKDLWDRWSDQNARLPAVANRLMFALPETDDVMSEARRDDHKRQKTGLERINPNALPTTDQRFKLETAEEQTAEIQYVEED